MAASSFRPRADRFTRLVVLAWIVAGILILTTVIRALMALGLFSFVSPVTLGACRTLALPGPGDLAYDYKSRTLFIAARDGAYALPEGASKPLKLAGPPAGFRPSALTIGYDLGGTPALLLMGHLKGGPMAIESYGVSFDSANVPHLASQNLIEGAPIARAQGIAALGNGRFYVAADQTRSDLMAWADRNLVLPRATVMFFNATLFRPAITGLSDPSGMALTADGRHLFVASRNQRRLLAFSLDPYSGNLTERGSLALPMRPEHLMVDQQGSVWVAGAPRLPAIAGGAKSPSRVVRVTVGSDGTPRSQQTVFADNGDRIGAASAVARTDGHLFIGSALDDKLLDCPYK